MWYDCLMDDISIDFLQELGEYNGELAGRIETSGVDHVREKIVACMRERAEKNPNSIHEWRRAFANIAMLKQKISELNKEIRKHVSDFAVSDEEYNDIMADKDLSKQQTRLINY